VTEFVFYWLERDELIVARDLGENFAIDANAVVAADLSQDQLSRKLRGDYEIPWLSEIGTLVYIGTV
jgi:hypothetical protein